MTGPEELLVGLRSSTAAFVTWLEGIEELDASMPSLLPAWTWGHVLTHLARNAEAIERTISGALRGERVERYPGGPAARDAAIEEGARREASALVADVSAAAAHLDATLAVATARGAWSLPTAQGLPVGDWVPRRRREVEIHWIDLGGTYTPAEWPADFVRDVLPELGSTLEQRATCALRVETSIQTWAVGTGDPVEVAGPDWAVLAWLIGRSQAAGTLRDAPELTPWS